ncbi:SMP-30/gluconolactonase/LRE family protein [Hymenobacter aerilatus]|uniref:SMP-30/gluconolactonase/LRE family protein n=1 Tax=Hymenobacter aerilatus TaxID=2932251 RepID=A0A8T9SZD2_9BACT|nr:SMP-30/gluconolactonase/LRE family protein [Hymenobacter aerilatus]UOR05186.1 SMP-30/gluconolactonase/LRE family protein [Hymenobacter aerilatus]
MRFLFLLLSCLPLLPVSATAQSSPNLTKGRIVRQDPSLDQLLGSDAKIEIVGSGFVHIEGPLWVADSSMLLFSDTKSRTIYRWSEQKGLSKFLENSGYTGRMPYGEEPGSNGLALDGKGNLLLCQHGDRRIAMLPLSQKSGLLTLTDRYDGKRYNSPNDVLAHPTNGAIYFTDPPFGLPQQEKDPLREISVSGVYRRDAKGRITQEVTDLSKPNGLAFTADGRTLYVSNADSLRPVIMQYDVRSNGKLSNGRVFFDMATLPKVRPKELPDGLKVDQAGNVYATGPGGVSILSPAGKLLGTLDPGEVAANCAWGDDGRTLYITANTFLCRIKTKAQGVVTRKKN